MCYNSSGTGQFVAADGNIKWKYSLRTDSDISWINAAKESWRGLLELGILASFENAVSNAKVIKRRTR
jgi:hypothetical protein